MTCGVAVAEDEALLSIALALAVSPETEMPISSAVLVEVLAAVLMITRWVRNNEQ